MSQIILKSSLPSVKHVFEHIKMDIKSLAEQVGAGIALLGSLMVLTTKFHRKIIVPTRRWLAQAEETHKIVSEQLLTNGGSSLRDAINRIEHQYMDHKAGFHSWMTLVTEAKSGMFEANKAGQCTWTNPIYKMWTGRMEEELAGDAWVGTIFPADRDMVVEGWEEAVKQQRDFSGTFRMQDYLGNPFWIKCLAVVKRNGGRTFGWLGRIERVQEPAGGIPVVS